MLHGLEQAGVMAVEIGIPFSDPIADGPDLQRAAEAALRNRVTPELVLDLVRRYRTAGGRLPIVLMTYANPIVRGGIHAFAAAAAKAGVDGVLVSDLPPDEAPEVWTALDGAGLDTVLLVAPTTPRERLQAIVGRCRGFVYCLARTGVTGGSQGWSGSIDERIAEVRGLTKLPVAIGFGVSTAEQAGSLRGRCDAVVVGAALMREVTADPARGAVDRVVARATEMAQALSQAPA
jgi:tryptophan synthase alpha chain